MNAIATATPPPRGTGPLVDPPLVGLVDRAVADRDPPDERRQQERDGGRGDEGDETGTGCRGLAVKVTPVTPRVAGRRPVTAGEAGHREAAR